MQVQLEKREKCIRKKLEVYTSIHFYTSTGRCTVQCILRLVGGVHTTLPYTTPLGKKLAVYTLLDYIHSPASLRCSTVIEKSKTKIEKSKTNTDRGFY